MNGKKIWEDDHHDQPWVWGWGWKEEECRQT